MTIPENPLPMQAGEFPALVAAACKTCKVDPCDLMAWSVNPNQVVLVLGDGRKVVFAVVGKWFVKQPELFKPEEEPLSLPLSVKRREEARTGRRKPK
jgi:hypothetical protein